MSFQKSLLFFILIAATATAQKKFELGKVSIAELQESEHPKEPSASAAVLFEKGDIRFEYSQADGFQRTLTVKARLKIYKKDGYDWANKAVRYYSAGSYNEKISFTDVATYNLVDGKIERTKMKSDGEFDERANKYWGRRKITLPNVREGSVIEYQYTIKSPGIGRFQDWDFQGPIPVNYSELVTNVPEYFVYNTNLRGATPKVTVDKLSKSVSYSYREENVPGGSIIHSTTQEKLDFTETKTSYIAENMPSMKDESYVNNIRNYTSGISHELSIVKYPNAPLKSYSTNWEAVAKEIYKYDDFGPELEKTGYFEADVAAVTKGLTDQKLIIAAIFNHVMDSVKWDEYYGYSCNDGVRSAYKKKTGNAAEINLMLTSMLRYAGINANPILVSTRENGIAFFPSRTAFNYVISGAETPTGLVLLDATEKFSMPDVLPLRDLNWFGRLIRKDGSSEMVELTPKTLSREVNYLSATLKPDGTAEGKIRTQYLDHQALECRGKAVGIAKESYLEKLESENGAIEISDYTRDNDLDLSKPIIESYAFKDARHAEIIDSKIYFSPLLFLGMTENPFRQDKREYPIDFGYPKEMKFNISIDIPEGYRIESMPAAITLITGDDIGSFKYGIASNGNKIQVSIVSTINAAIVPADYYEVIKEYYQKVLAKQQEKIILVKA